MNQLISPEDEAEYRVMCRNMYKNVGFEGMFRCMAEMVKCVQTLNEVIQEIAEEEKKKL